MAEPGRTAGAVLATGGSVVTATRRLARRLRAEHAASVTAPSWQTPRVLPWSAWLVDSYREGRDFGAPQCARLLLDEHQATAVWAQAFADDRLAGELLMPGGAVDGFREAWGLVHDWRLAWRDIGARASEDCQAFLRVAQGYRARLEALGAIDMDMLPAIVAAQRAAPGEEALWFAGFDRLSPAQQALYEAPGVRGRRATQISRSREATLAACSDLRAELEAAASWARARLALDPAARLAIAVPELSAAASLVEDIFDAALAPVRLLPGQGDAPKPWNISLGRPLAQAPPVAAALRACELLGGPLEPAQAGRLLRSPFFGGSRLEGAARARLDAWIREHAGGSLTPAQLLAWLGGQEGAPGTPQLARGMQGLFEALRDGTARRPPSAWAGALTRGLQRLGWPGEDTLDSVTWQSAQAWAEALASFACLDVVTGVLSWPEALSRLRHICGARLFQPETADVPVQVLGLLEIAGLEFDGLWVVGMHDGVLPAPLRPCPMLPASLQRERAMPRACPATEYALAQRLVAQLSAAAPEVRFSYPLNREDEPLRPSPIVAQLPPATTLPKRFPGMAAAGFASRRLESLADGSGPPVAGEVSGGTSLLATQAACPFMAFVTHRLAAGPFRTAGAGVDELARGSFMHLALRGLWERLAGQEALAALDAAGREGRVRAALESAAAVALADVPTGLVRIEIDEAAARISELLALELQRPAFEVAAVEQAVTIAIGPLRLRGQVDRVDRVPGGVAIIDYKSGAASPADWDGERPQQPQLPLYALAFAEEVVALVFASLKPGGVTLRGVAMTQEALGAALKIRGDASAAEWREMLAGWRAILGALASSFADGDARIDPLRVTGAGSPCPRCHAQVLCRRDELLRAGVLVDE
jgi:ATP-dependent helicase/nuclease subunit B